MNFGVIGPGDIGEVIVRKLRDAGYPLGGHPKPANDGHLKTGQ
jgi:prephenate dehydrogenase